MSLRRAACLILAIALFALSFGGIAEAQLFDALFQIDPALALNGFVALAGVIVLLFETYRSRP